MDWFKGKSDRTALELVVKKIISSRFVVFNITNQNGMVYEVGFTWLKD